MQTDILDATATKAEQRQTNTGNDDHRTIFEAPQIKLATIPYPLRDAYNRLIKALSAGIKQFNHNQQFMNSGEVQSAIDRYIDEFFRRAVWKSELERRVHMVEHECRESSVYDLAREKALKSYRGHPRKQTPGKLAIEKLRGERTRGPILLSELVEVRQNIKALLQADNINLGAGAVSAFGELLDESLRVQRNAVRLEVDGCWYLYHVYQAAPSKASDRSKTAEFIIAGDTLGGVHLKLMRDAAESLVEWARDNPTAESAATQETNVHLVEGDPDTGGESGFDLSNTKRLILKAILELGAVEKQQNVSCPQTATKVKMNPDARLRSELADLRTLKLLGGKKGQRGYWLTPAGIREANRV